MKPRRGSPTKTFASGFRVFADFREQLWCFRAFTASFFCGRRTDTQSLLALVDECLLRVAGRIVA